MSYPHPQTKYINNNQPSWLIPVPTAGGWLYPLEQLGAYGEAAGPFPQPKPEGGLTCREEGESRVGAEPPAPPEGARYL